MAQVARFDAAGKTKPFELEEALIKGFQNDCTDLHIRAHDFPIYRLHGKLIRDKAYPVFEPEDTKKVAMSLINDYQKNNLE